MSEQTPGYVVDYVRERYAAASDADEWSKLQAAANWRQWRGVLPDDWPYFSRIFEPVSAVALTDVEEGIVSGMFGRDNFFDVEPLEGQSDISTELMRVLVQEELRRMRYKRIKFEQTREAVLFGNGVVRHHSVPVRGPDGLMEMHAQESVVSRFNFHPGPGGRTIAEMPYAVEVMQVPLEKALRWVKDPEQADKLRKNSYAYDVSERRIFAGRASETQFDLFTRLAEVGYSVSSNGVPAGDKLPKFVTVWLYCEKPADEDGCSRVVMVAGGDVLMSDLMNPYRHGQKCWSSVEYAMLDTSLWQATGLLELIAALQGKINMRSCQFSDLIEMLRRPETWVGKGAMMKDLSLLEPWPGKVIPIEGDASQIQRQTNSGMAGAIEVLRDLDNSVAMVQRVSQRTDVGRGMIGQSSGLNRGTETATGIQMLVEMQMRSSNFKWAQMEEGGFKDGLERTASIAAQCVSAPRMMRVGDNETLRGLGYGDTLVLSPEDLVGRWGFKAVGMAQTVENPQRAQLLKDWITEGMNHPDIAPRVKALEAWQEIGQMLRVPTPSKFVRSDEEMAQQTAMASPTPEAMMAAGAGVPAPTQ